MGYKIRPCSVGFTRNPETQLNEAVVYWEVYEEAVLSTVSFGTLPYQTKAERIIAKDVTKAQAKMILKEILSEG